jgi:hypothetical protein
MLDDSIATLVGTTSDPTPGGTTVYNLTVAGGHTYFVAGEGPEIEPIWVHNAICGRRGGLLHQAQVAAVEAAMKARGLIHLEGGSLPELAARIGSKIRYADLVFEEASGARVAFQIGRREVRSGLSVLRERLAIADLKLSIFDSKALSRIFFIKY